MAKTSIGPLSRPRPWHPDSFETSGMAGPVRAVGWRKASGLLFRVSGPEQQSVNGTEQSLPIGSWVHYAARPERRPFFCALLPNGRNKPFRARRPERQA
jgi:hypothetical protein